MEDFVVRRRATYRQKVPKPVWRAIPDEAAEQLFEVLPCHRDRAGELEQLLDPDAGVAKGLGAFVKLVAPPYPLTEPAASHLSSQFGWVPSVSHGAGIAVTSTDVVRDKSGTDSRGPEKR
jgi:hypothetical protein